MNDPSRPESRTRTPVITIDREGRLVGFQELTDEEIQRLREAHAQGAEVSPEPAGPSPSVTCGRGRPIGGREVVTYTYTYGPDDPPPPRYRFEHDPAARVFRLTAADGTVEAFRDNPTRYLCVEPDPESGEMRPVVKRGRPVYLHLCREEREAGPPA